MAEMVRQIRRAGPKPYSKDDVPAQRNGEAVFVENTAYSGGFTHGHDRGGFDVIGSV